MLKIKTLILTILTFTLISCSDENDKFPLDKRYWDTMDYVNVTRELKYGYEADEHLPTFNNPETRAIVEKYTDHQNFNVVLDDKELGTKHRNKVAEDFFNRWKDMTTVYQATNRQDKYLYEQEMLAVEHFGLDLQLKYFKLGNDELMEDSDDPNSSRTRNAVNSNIKTLISNFNQYLDEVNNEDAFSEEGKKLFSKGLSEYFTELIEIYPSANYSVMAKKINLMLKKTNSSDVKNSLNKINDLIKSKESAE